jgi:peptidoglycan hydrolase-like protein with peptidoglycan-binding domain
MADEPTLKRGHNNPHDWVVYAQKMLNQALAGGMHIDVPEDGKFDKDFEDAIIAFQQNHGLAHDGEIGPKTWAAFHRAIEKKQHNAQAAQAVEDEQLRSTPREVHNEPGHRNDNTFHQRPDGQGNTTRVYDMDAEQLVGGPGAEEFNTAVALMVEKAEKNTGEQLQYVLSGLLEFQKESQDKIAHFVAKAKHFEDEAHVHFPWGLLVDGLDHALGLAFTVEGPWAGWIYEKIKGAFTSALVEELESHTSQVPGLQAKLEAGITVLVDRANRESRAGVDELKAGILDYITDQMQAYANEKVTTDANWIDEMVKYFGFPPSTEANVSYPIIHSLDQQFDAMLADAEQEFLKNA